MTPNERRKHDFKWSYKTLIIHSFLQLEQIYEINSYRSEVQQCIECGKAFICVNYPCRIERNQIGEKFSVCSHCAKALSYDTHILRN